MEDDSLLRMAVARGLLTNDQIDGLRKAQADLADRGLNRGLWFLAGDLGYIDEDQERDLRRDLSARTRGGRTIAGYEILRRLGKGGMGEVFLAKGPDHQTVAIKLLSHDSRSEDLSEQRFQREISAALNLVHPAIVRGLASGMDDGRPYLVLEYVVGPSLKERIAEGCPLNRIEALSLLTQAALGLRHAWRRGVLHRDVKPGNMLLAAPRPGIPEPFCSKICDFGLAKIHNGLSRAPDDGSRPGMVLGTPLYMSPEQAQASDDLEQRADIFGLAASVFHACTLHPIQGAADLESLLYRRIHEDVDLSPLAAAQLGADFCDLLAAMLRRSRSERIQDWDWVLHACRRIDRSVVDPLLIQGIKSFRPDPGKAEEVDPSQAYIALAARRIDDLTEGVERQMRTLQDHADDPLQAMAMSRMRGSLHTVRSLAWNLLGILEPSGSKRTFDLRELAQAAVQELTELSTLCWIPITIEGDGSAFGSPEDSRLALFNLLRNAILACRRDGKIRIRIRNNVLVIADQGHGLPPGLRKNLFNPTSHDRVFGLGATTARICQRRQGGDVRLLMTGPSGTAFGMLWPRV